MKIFSPSQIWSGDETGVQNVPKEVRVLGVKNVRTFQQVSSEQGETSTILTFVNAMGDVVPPMVIHKACRVQESWKIKAPGDVRLAATTKGYITKSRFHEYGIRFIRYLKQHGLADRPNLLIIDGHKSHVYNLPFYTTMRDNNVEIITIPPHTSHVLQALDSVPFAQFKKLWEHYLRRYNTAHHGRSLSKIDFWDVFTPAWNGSMVPKNVLAGFRKTGIYPYNPDEIPVSAMAPSTVTEKSNGENCWSSVLVESSSCSTVSPSISTSLMNLIGLSCFRFWNQNKRHRSSLSNTYHVYVHQSVCNRASSLNHIACFS